MRERIWGGLSVPLEENYMAVHINMRFEKWLEALYQEAVHSASGLCAFIP